MSRPRIAFCYKYGLLGGVSAQLLNRYPYLSREFEISIVYESDHGMASRFPAGVARSAPTVESMEAAIREIEPDITVVIDSPAFLDAWRAAGSVGKLVLEVHTTTANQTYLNYRDQLAGVAHIVTVSSYMERLLRAYGLGDLAPITVVPNCLDYRWSSPGTAELLDGKPVLWVGKLDGHKRWRSAVDLTDDLAQEHDLSVLPILVGGLTAPESEIQALTTRLATSPGLARAVWWPRVEYDRMPALYSSVGASGGVHLCTTSNESFGMAVAESLVRTCPVVAPAVGALPELLPSSALFRPGDWTEARQKARRALVDSVFREELLSTADRVRDLTAPERVLDAYRTVFSAVLAGPQLTVAPRPRVSAAKSGLAAAPSTQSGLVASDEAAWADSPAEPSASTASDVASVSPRVASAPAVATEESTPAPRVVPVSVGETTSDGDLPSPAPPASRSTDPPPGPMSVIPRSPFAVTSTEHLELSSQTRWIDADLVPGDVYRLRAVTEGTLGTADNAAIVRFDVAEGVPDGGRGLTLSPTVGPYMYLVTGPGLRRTDRLFTVVKRMRRYGLASWDNRGPVALKTLTIEKVNGLERPVDFFLSFDVEALPGRAPSDRIDRLVWGNIGGGSYGIGRICDVLDEYGLKANFMLDYASCLRDGDRGVRRIVDFLAARGHEIHLHLHSEWLARYWGLNGPQAAYLDKTSYGMSRRMLDFAMAKHVEFTGQSPRVFRAGGFRVNPDFVLAAGALGMEALTNIRNNMVHDGIGGDIQDAREPFLWDNGVLEIPVDLSPEPLSEAIEKYIGRFEAVVPRKATERTFNLVMHSWSLTRRNEQGFQEAFEPEHEERLHQIFNHIVRHGKAYGYAEFLDSRHLPRPRVKVAGLDSAEPEPKIHADGIEVTTCNVCDAVFARSSMESDICPACGSRERHRQMRFVLDTYGNLFDGRSVLACHATSMERLAFLGGTTAVVNFDVRPIHGRDLQMDIQHMHLIEDNAFDCFLALHVLNHVKDDKLAMSEIARVLRPGGVFVSTVPYHDADGTVEFDDVTETYGVEALERFGVGSYRRYGLADYLDLLSTHFRVTSLPGLDPVTNRPSRVFLAYKA